MDKQDLCSLLETHRLENIQYRGRLRKSATITVAAHILAFLAPSIPVIFNHSHQESYQQQNQERVVQLLPIVEPPAGYYGNRYGFNPKVEISKDTTSSDLDKKIGDTLILESAVVPTTSLDEKLDKLILIDSDPTELYKHTYKNGDRNKSTYFDFFYSYLGAYSNLNFNESSIKNELEKNMDTRYIMKVELVIAKDGSIGYIGYYKNPLLDDNEETILNQYLDVFKRMPKKFVPLTMIDSLLFAYHFSFTMLNPISGMPETNNDREILNIFKGSNLVPIYQDSKFLDSKIPNDSTFITIGPK